MAKRPPIGPLEFGKDFDRISREIAEADGRRRSQALRKSALGKFQFVFDIEVTGLNDIIFQSVPGTFQRDISKIAEIVRDEGGLSALGDPRNRKAIHKALEYVRGSGSVEFYQYFDNIGLAQSVVLGRSGKLQFGLGYSAYDPKAKTSLFSEINGITSRPFDPGNSRHLRSEEQRVLQWGKHLQRQLSTGKVIEGLGQNVMFDAMGMSAFSIRHGEALLAAGISPFQGIAAYSKGNLRFTGMEENYFDFIRTRGIMDDKWSKRWLVHGRNAQKIFPDLPGIQPGSPIDVAADWERRQAGKPSLLRSRAGWSQAGIEDVFGRYLQPEKGELALGRKFVSRFHSHDAIRDTVYELFYAQRFRRAHVLQNLYATANQHRGISAEQVDVLAMSRSGFLGKRFEMAGIDDDLVAGRKILDQPRTYGEALYRRNKLWTRWEGRLRRGTDSLTESARQANLAEGINPAVKRATWGRVNRLINFDRGARKLFTQTAINQRARDVGRTTLGFGDFGSLAAGRFGKISRTGKFGIIAGLATGIGYVLWNAIGRRPDAGKLQANLPSNYLKGQQGNPDNREINVPWASPYQGTKDDDDTISLIRGGRMFAGLVGAHYLPQVLLKGLGPERGQRWIQNLTVFATRVEEATPFRVGRMFGIAGKLSSYSTPETMRISQDLLFHRGTRSITTLGKVYSRALGLSDENLFTATRGERGNLSGGLRFQRTTGPWMETKLRGGFGRHEVRFFHGSSRPGQSLALYGAARGEIDTAITPARQSERVLEMLNPRRDPRQIGGGISAFRRRILGAGYRRSSAVRRMVDTWASIPSWDSDVTKSLRRSDHKALLGDLWIPGYRRPTNLVGRAIGPMASARAMGGGLFDAFRTTWHLMRSSAAAVGVRLKTPTSMRGFIKASAGLGIAVHLGIKGFEYLDSKSSGLVSAPIRNAWQRANLARAAISDRLGFTSIRKQHPDTYSWMAGALFATPLLTLGMARWGHRQARVNRELGHFKQALRGTTPRYSVGNVGLGPAGPGQFQMMTAGRPKDALLGRAGARHSFLEHAFQRSKLQADTGIKQYFKNAKWLRGTKLGMLAGAVALSVPFVFGTKESYEELQNIYAGRKKVPIRSGRFWEMGGTPYEGRKTKQFRFHWTVRQKIRGQENVPGEGPPKILRSIMDPYWREKEAYYTRPYPITGSPGEDIPFVGHILSRTLGRFFKPPLRMHSGEWGTNDPYIPLQRDAEPSSDLGGLGPARPQDPLGWRALARETWYKGTEYMGLRGFLSQRVGQSVYGEGEVPYGLGATLQPAKFRDFTERFYEAESGGMMGLNEGFRRFYPRPTRGIEVNPLRNQMPDWLPGSNYFIDFKSGDPYRKVPNGEERLPGPGLASYYPELADVAPKDYPSWAKFMVLADVAPWSREYDSMKKRVFSEYAQDPQMTSHLFDIEDQVEQIKRKKDFDQRKFTDDTETVRATVKSIADDGSFQVSEYPRHTFRMSGASTKMNRVAEHLQSIRGYTKEKAVEVAATQRVEAQQEMMGLMAGRPVSLKIHRGGLNAPEVFAEINAGGVNVNRRLIEEGYAAPGPGPASASFVERQFGKAVETVGHGVHKVPGPWMMFTKLFNQADAVEEYRRTQLYGTESRFWDDPWGNFLRPYMHSAISKFTPGDYVPSHTQDRRDLDVAYDRLAFKKAIRNGRMGAAHRTAAGGDMLASEDFVATVLPKRERPYFHEFARETDPSRREEILGIVPQDTGRALVGQWTQQYAATQGVRATGVDPNTRIQNALNLADREIQDAGLQTPGNDWVGWNAQANLEDIRAVQLRSQGKDLHDFDIWNDKLEALSRKPYLNGSHEYLTSRRLQVPTPILSHEYDNKSSEMTFFSERLSNSLVSSFNQHNTLDWRSHESAMFLKSKDSLLNG